MPQQARGFVVGRNHSPRQHGHGHGHGHGQGSSESSHPQQTSTRRLLIPILVLCLALTGVTIFLMPGGSSRANLLMTRSVKRVNMKNVGRGGTGSKLASTGHTLRFKVCNGYANQRISVLYGILLAVKTNRIPVIPILVGDGMQTSTSNVLSNRANQLPFSFMYDTDFFVWHLAKAGITVLKEDDAPSMGSYVQISLVSLGFNLPSTIKSSYQTVPHLSIDCPLFKLFANDLTPEDTPIIWAVLNAFKPAKDAMESIELISQRIGSMHPKGFFNVLHLRMERDWLAHCWRWSNINDGIVRNNCMNNTEDIDVYLRVMGLSPSIPLYVATYWQDTDPRLNHSIMTRLKAAKYNVVSLPSLLASDSMPSMKREQLALIEYYVALMAHKFIGNSVSTFSALAMLERRHLGRWAAYYNAGNVPITALLPTLHTLPWVFTHNSWSPGYDYMLKAALRSAMKFKSLKPYCIFNGDDRSEIYSWLLQHNVTIIRHKPSWGQLLVQKAKETSGENNLLKKQNKSADVLISSFQRIDVAVVPILNQYTYVLYTDGDVIFRAPVTLDSFGLPLPTVLSMSWEFRNQLPFNAGVMLMNLPELRASYHEFLAFIFSNEQGLHFGKYGPADQGAFNQFYEEQLKSRVLDQKYNSKPYNDMISDAVIVHFHGPKPHEYVQYLETGKCNFYWLCEQAFLRSVCWYSKDLRYYMHENPNVRDRLTFACKWLSNPEARTTWIKTEAPTPTLLDLHKKLHTTQAALQGGELTLLEDTQQEGRGKPLKLFNAKGHVLRGLVPAVTSSEMLRHGVFKADHTHKLGFNLHAQEMSVALADAPSGLEEDSYESS